MKVLKWVGIIIVGFVVIGFLSALLGDNDEGASINTSAPSSNSSPSSGTEPQTKTEPPATSKKYIKSGMYKIGKDLPVGEYLIIPSGMAYYQVTKDSTGSLDSIISNDNFSGTRYVTVSEGQYLEIRSSKMISAADADLQQAKNNTYPEGMYKIGEEIPPGEYKVISDGGFAYYEVSRDSRGNLDSIIANDNFSGEKYISVSSGQYLKLNGCKLIR